MDIIHSRILRSASLGALAALLIAFALPISAEAIWPEHWREHARQKSLPVVVPDPQLWAECSGEMAEKAIYDSPVGRFSATAYRLKDATTALTWYEFLRPESAVPVRDKPWSATTPGAQFALYQNYVLVFEGWRPLDKEMDALYKLLPKVHSGGGLPLLVQHLPETGRVRNSERYLIGLHSLDLFANQVPAALAGFESGAEAALARYQTPMGDLPLILFEYPTPQIARDHMASFEKQPGWQVKRSGPLVAVIPAQPALKLDAAGARPLFDSIQWDLEFTWYESAKRTPQPNVAAMLLGAFKLTGVLLLAMFLGGVFFASIGVWLRRRGLKEGEEPGMISLHLNG
ncbi:MAG: hypothetical protein P4K98_02660 [Bryobacteraceae bacterium]|nr:hypothetical protein [Bryobacteraceae bacterium]